MTVQFAIPKLLLLIWLVPAVAAWWYAADRRRERALERFVSAQMQSRLRPAGVSSRFAWQLVLMSIGLALSIVAAARPQWGQRDELVYSRGRDLIILLDVSRSMLATDVHPNRLQRAKIDLVDLIDELRGDRASLIAFRGGATDLCPLTTDYAYLKTALDGAAPYSAPRGETDIGKAIRTALESYEGESGSHKALILVSDGEDLKGDALKAAQKAAEKGITIFTVGLGSTEGAQIPDADQSGGLAMHRGSAIISRLDNEALYEISRITGGAYIPVGTASLGDSTLGTLYRNHLRKISERDLEETLQRRYVERFQWFLLPGILFMLIGTGLSRGRLANRASGTDTSGKGPEPEELKNLNPPERELKVLCIGFCIFLGAASTSRADTNATASSEADLKIPAGRAGARVAQKRFKRGDYRGAADAYLKAAADATRKSQLDFRHNAAAALFQDGQHEAAADILRELSHQGSKHQARTEHGLGAALYRASESVGGMDADARDTRLRLLEESADAFRRGGRSVPDDEVARQNISIAVDALHREKAEAKIAKLNEQYQSEGSDRLAARMLAAQRDISLGIRRAMTNTSPSRIYELEALAEQQEANADLWIPLKGKLMAAFSESGSDRSPAEIDQAIEATRDTMLAAAGNLRDLDPESDRIVQMSEAAIYQLWKSIAPPESLLSEDIRQQTNVIIATESPRLAVIPPGAAPALQTEARELTRLFATRFEQVKPVETPPQQGMPSTSNMVSQAVPMPQQPGVDAETHAKILDLAMQAEATQGAAIKMLDSGNKAKSLVQQKLSYRILKEIEELMPRPPPQQSQQEQQEQESQQEQEPEEQERQDAQEQEPEEAQDMPPEQEQEPEAQEPAAEQEEGEEEALSEEDVKRLLDRALQREREHEAEKRKRRDSRPLSPMDRDW